MNGDAVKEVERLAKAAVAQIIKLDGKQFSTTPIFHYVEPAEHEPDTLVVATLQGLVDYSREDACVAYVTDRRAFVHIEGPGSVRLVTGIFGEHKQQVVLALAKAIVPKIPFGEWQDPETFNIGLMAHFADTPDRAKVLALTGNIRADTSVNVAEDGVRQTVTATRGVAFKENAPVPTVVELEPWRTFSEIAPQPRSAFILRIRAGGDGRMPSCALFEADGGVWRLDAVKAVKTWLKDELGDEIAVYG